MATVVYLVQGIMKEIHEVNLANDVLTKCAEFKPKEKARRQRKGVEWVSNRNQRKSKLLYVLIHQSQG